MSNPTLRSLLALPDTPESLKKSALVLIDCQNTYREGVMQLEGVEPALERMRQAPRPRPREPARRSSTSSTTQAPARPTTPRRRSAPSPMSSRPRPARPSSPRPIRAHSRKPISTPTLKRLGVTDLVLAGFMTHVCVNSTARAAFNLGYRPTVVANATATRSLPNPLGGDVPAAADAHRRARSAGRHLRHRGTLRG